MTIYFVLTVTGYQRNVSIRGCIKFQVTTNACRGYCTSYAFPSPSYVLQANPNHMITSRAECCSIEKTHDVSGPNTAKYKHKYSCICSVTAHAWRCFEKVSLTLLLTVLFAGACECEVHWRDTQTDLQVGRVLCLLHVSERLRVEEAEDHQESTSSRYLHLSIKHTCDLCWRTPVSPHPIPLLALDWALQPQDKRTASGISHV